MKGGLALAVKVIGVKGQKEKLFLLRFEGVIILNYGHVSHKLQIVCHKNLVLAFRI